MKLMAKTKKLALILAKESSSWRSCQVIVPNLYELYKQSFPKCTIEAFDYSEGMGEYDYFCSIQNLINFNPDKIIILDHKPHPERIIRDLMREWTEEKFPPLYCHLFGDFSLNAPDWLHLESCLQRLKIKFIAASHRQVDFVKQFIDEDGAQVSYLPFPVDEKKYYFSPENQKMAKEKLGLNNKGKNFLYTGRISTQKNVVSLIQSFKKFLDLSGSKSHLYIAGFFDNLGLPYFGVYHPKEFNRYEFIECLEEIEDSSATEQIHFLGNLTGDELFDYYHGCDFFVSLSTHNDEDYGMAPAEALCCGMPLILSDWGGYASFCPPQMENNSLVKVKLLNSFYSVDHMNFIKLLMKYDTKTFKGRETLSLKGQDLFSINSNIKRLLKIHEEPLGKFSGWNEKFQKFSHCFEKSPQNPFGIIDISLNQEDIKDQQASIGSRKIYRDCYHEYTNKI